MSADINLLRKDEESIKRQHRVKVFNFVAIASLIGVGILSLILFLLIQTINSPSVKKEQDDIFKKISQFQDKQAKLLVINNRIDNIEAILAGRKDLSKASSVLLTKIPARLLVESMEINDKSIVISASSPSLFVVGQFISNLTDMVRNKEIISSLVLNSLAFDSTRNTYHLSVRSDL
ncbi:MAG: hypothetical protein Q7R51_00640 [bacterium]|nr:hypothetical protein [bacterium]